MVIGQPLTPIADNAEALPVIVLVRPRQIAMVKLRPYRGGLLIIDRQPTGAAEELNRRHRAVDEILPAHDRVALAGFNERVEVAF